MGLRVAVLMGGDSAEREVSLRSGARVAAGLREAGHEVVTVDLRQLPAEALETLRRGALGEPVSLPVEACVQQALDGTPALKNGRLDAAFIALHGGEGEGGGVQALLDAIGLRYIGSDAAASARSLDKIAAKDVLVAEGIPTPRYLAWRAVRDPAAVAREAAPLGLPVVVKPSREGSSLGLTIVRETAALPAAIARAREYDRDLLIEQFSPGTEITASVLGNERLEVLPLVEIVPRSGVYDYEAKYTPGATEEIVPARIPEAMAARARDYAARAHRALGCRGLSRVDMIAGETEVMVLEVNTIPGLTETSLLPRAAEAAGISFSQLVDRILRLAVEGGRACPGGRR